MKKFFTKSMLALIVISFTIASASQAETLNSVQDGNWKNPDNWDLGVVPTSADSVIVQHLIDIYTGDSCMHLYVAPAGTIQNMINGTRLLVVTGNLRIDGTATYTNNYFNIRLGGNLHLNGTWDSPQVFFMGNSEQTISAAPGKIFGASRSGVDFEDIDPATPLKFATDIIFDDITLVMNNTTIAFTPGIEVTLHEEEIDEAVIIGNNSSLRMGNGSYLVNCDIENLTFKGTVNIGSGNTASGEIINADTLQNLINSSRTLQVFGNFTNQGVIQETNNHLHFIVHGNITNSGEWTSSDVRLDGAQDHHITFNPEAFIFCDEIENLDPTAQIILLSDIEIRNAIIEPDGGTIDANNHMISLRQNAFVYACTIIDPQLGGEFKVHSGVVLSGDVVVVDSLMQRNIFSNISITVDGDLFNNGLILRNPYSIGYGLQIDLTGDLENNGFFDVERLRFTGLQDQHVNSSQKGAEMSCEVFGDTDPASHILFDADITLINSKVELDDSTIELNNVNLFMMGGYLQDGYLNAQQNLVHLSGDAYMINLRVSEAHVGGDCQITGAQNHFENVIVDDTLRNKNIYAGLKLTTSGDFINNGVITSHNTYHIELHVEGNFYNHGNALLSKTNFTGTGIQEFSGATGIIQDADIVNAKTDGYVLAVDDLNFSNCEVSFSDKELYLQNANIYADSGQIKDILIHGSGNELTMDNGGFIYDVYLEDITLKNNVGMRGTENTFLNVIIADTLSRGGNYNHDIEIETVGTLQNNGYIDSDNDSYDFVFFVEDTMVNNGIFMAEKIQFVGSETHYIQSQGGNTFELEQMFNPANGGPVEVISELLVKNANMDFNGYELNLPEGGLLQMDNTVMDDVVVYAAGNAVITGLNESVIKFSTIDGALLFGNFEIHEDNTFKDCVLDAALVNDNIYSDVVLNLEGLIENNTIIQNREPWSYELYLNVFGDLMHDGVIECEEARWQGSDDQDIYLLNGNEINTPSEFDAMSSSSPFQWYKNDVLIDGATNRQYNMPMIGVADRGYYHCETGQGPSRTIRICTPVEIDLAAEAWFCQEESVMLDPEITFGEPPYAWSWEPAAGLSNPNIRNPEANPAEPTLYTLVVTDAIGCTGQINIMVQQYPQVFASAGNDKEICLGLSTVLNGSASGGVADYIYHWTPATGLNNPDVATPVASPLINTTYTLTVTDQNGCVETDEVTVIVNPLPEVFGLSQDSTHFCYGQDTSIVWLLGSQVGVDYYVYVNGQPNPGGEVYPGTGEAIDIWAETTIQGHYTILAVNATTGCEEVMNGYVMIYIDFLPEVVDQSGDVEMLEGESTTLWVDVTSTQPPWLQWYKDGEMIDGATGYQYIISDATMDDTGEYWCVVANNCDVAQSEPVTVLVSQQQMIELSAGWSGFSTYLDVYDPALTVMFEDLGDGLVIVNDFDNMYWPAGGVNTYLNWETQRGAQIKLEESATLDLRGIHTSDKALMLGTGWHYLPVLSNCQVNAQDLLSPLGDAVELVKDIAGTDLYWPEFDIYTLTTLDPGKAYFLKLSQDATITYPECTKQSGVAPVPLKPGNTSPWPDPANTPVSHIIAVPASAYSGALQPGDWVGVFTPWGVCSGLARCNGSQMAITVFGADRTANSVQGFSEGEHMRFKFFSEATGEVRGFTPAFTVDSDGAAFKANGISVVEDFRILGSGGEAFTVYPNPATDYLFVSGIAPGVAWKLCNATGVVVASGTLAADLKISLPGIQPGIYTLQVAGVLKCEYQQVIVK